MEKRVNGIQVGRVLRSDVTNEIIQIVYISVEKNHEMQFFKNRPVDYLIMLVI